MSTLREKLAGGPWRNVLRPQPQEVGAATLREKFDAVGPWFTRYEIEGLTLGGANSYDDDRRVDLFFKWLSQPHTILELGSFEGAHSLQLAAPQFVERVVGLEGRPENIARGRLATALLGRGNIEFIQMDLDEPAMLSQFGRFDAVFCAGLFYHLARPWTLIENVAGVTDRFFLDTHYSLANEVRVEGYEGAYYDEGGYTDPLSGLSEASLWLTLPCIDETLQRSGFCIHHKETVADWAGAGPRVHLAAVKESP
jgi:hypothetical protein